MASLNKDIDKMFAEIKDPGSTDKKYIYERVDTKLYRREFGKQERELISEYGTINGEKE
jgi:hypothetical protein|tara:strand:+ start:1949 stop:2125 length:177 start_codon:yes stop_codon:yes gene_type:complete